MSSGEFGFSQEQLAGTRTNDDGADIHSGADPSQGAGSLSYGFPSDSPPAPGANQPAPQQNQVDPNQQNAYPAFDSTPATRPGYEDIQAGQQSQNGLGQQSVGGSSPDAKRQQVLAEAQTLGILNEVSNLPTEQIEAFIDQQIRFVTGQNMGFNGQQQQPQQQQPQQQQGQQPLAEPENPHKWPEQFDADLFDQSAIDAFNHLHHSSQQTQQLLQDVVGYLQHNEQKMMVSEANSALDALGDPALGRSDSQLSPLAQMQRDQIIQSAMAIRNGFQQQGKDIQLRQAIAMAHRSTGAGTNMIRQNMQQAAQARNGQIAGTPSHKTPAKQGSEATQLWHQIQSENARTDGYVQ